MSETNKILHERKTNYGNFTSQAALSQALKNGVMQHYFNTHGGGEAKSLPPYMVEALNMICHKIARIANGDPYHVDSWQDISGYAELVVQELSELQQDLNEAQQTQPRQ